MSRKSKLTAVIIPIASISFVIMVFMHDIYLDSKFDKVTITSNDFLKAGFITEDFYGTPQISRLQAVNIAKNEWHYNNVKDDNISAQLNLMTCNNVKNSPVWVISFRRLEIHSSSPGSRDGKPMPVRYHTEDNVVIDATTGKSLFAFTFR